MRDLLTKDLAWKFSTFLAVTIWVTVHKINGESEIAPTPMEGRTITFEGLPVLPVSSASDVKDFRVTPAAVTVTVSGPPDIMAELQGSQIRALVNLTDITNAAAKNLDRPVEVSTPPGVTLTSVTPDMVRVNLPAD